jgi:hypothetical protein
MRWGLAAQKKVPMVRAIVVDKCGELGHHAPHTNSPCFGPSSTRTPREKRKMRKSLWIILAAIVVTVAAPSAHADSFTATFTCTVGTCTTPLPVASDVTFPASTTWTITFAGATFGLDVNAISSPSTATYDWGTGGINDSEVGLFIILAPPGLGAATNSTPVSALFVLDEGGTVTFAAVTAPEPSSVALMLLGLGLVFGLRKRIAQGVPQAS